MKSNPTESQPASVRMVSRRILCKMGALALGNLALPWGCHRPAAPPGRHWSSMEELIEALDGPHNYLPTPFQADYSVDLEGLRRNVAFHAERDRLTVVVGGGYGEGWKLNLEEHREVVAATVAGARRQMPVMAGVIGGYRISMDMARNAEKAGADALVIFPPRGNWPAESYYEFYRDILNAVSIGAVVLPKGQDDFWPEVLIRLAEIPNMIGFFPSLGADQDYYPRTGGQILEAVAKPLLFMAENEPAASDSFSRGSRAYSTAAAALVPEASRRFWKHGVAGETAEMEEVLKNDLDPILKIRGYKPRYGISGIKVAMEALGRAGGPVRPPGTQVDPADRAGIAEILRRHPETRGQVIEGFA